MPVPRWFRGIEKQVMAHTASSSSGSALASGSPLRGGEALLGEAGSDAHPACGLATDVQNHSGACVVAERI